MPDEAVDVVRAFAPFSRQEVGRLERYVRRARQLAACQFVQTAQTFTMSGGVGQPLVVQTGEVDSEVHDALLLFRPLWLQGNEAGFSRVQAMVKRHAKQAGTDAGHHAIAMAKAHASAVQQVLSQPDILKLREQRVGPTGEVTSTEEVTARRIFEDFLNGVHFHEDEDRIARIGHPLQADIQRVIFYATVRHLTRIYVSFAHTPVAILREPSLRSGA